MATIELTDDELKVSLSKVEQLEALHGDVTVQRASVTSARVVDDVMDEVHGLRGPGTGVPGLVMIGTLHSHGTSTFAVAHGHHRGVLIELSGEAFDRLLVTCDDAHNVVTALAR